jgi:hypothetical protein
MVTQMTSEMDHLSRGYLLLLQNQFADAIVEFDAVLALAPENFYAHWNKATALLSLGDYTRGFAEHEYGWRLWNFRGPPVGADIERVRMLPLWRGECGGRLLVYHELGFGDAIMMLRYLPELARRAAVTLVALAPLHRLAQSVAPDVEVAERVPASLTGYDFRLPLFGTMLALRQTLADIPGAPYISADWQRLGGKKLGIAWAGRTQRSFPLADFLARLGHGYEFFSITAEPVDRPDVKALPPGDFVDTAARIACMDHVVTVDTAAAHLAGAMGHPSVHLLLPFMMDWRWWHAGTWYPAIKTYRQETPDDWYWPFRRLNEALVKGSPTA